MTMAVVISGALRRQASGSVTASAPTTRTGEATTSEARTSWRTNAARSSASAASTRRGCRRTAARTSQGRLIGVTLRASDGRGNRHPSRALRGVAEPLDSGDGEQHDEHERQGGVGEEKDVGNGDVRQAPDPADENEHADRGEDAVRSRLGFHWCPSLVENDWTPRPYGRVSAASSATRRISGSAGRGIFGASPGLWKPSRSPT